MFGLAPRACPTRHRFTAAAFNGSDHKLDLLPLCSRFNEGVRSKIDARVHILMERGQKLMHVFSFQWMYEVKNSVLVSMNAWGQKSCSRFNECVRQKLMHFSECMRSKIVFSFRWMCQVKNWCTLAHFDEGVRSKIDALCTFWWRREVKNWCTCAHFDEGVRSKIVFSFRWMCDVKNWCTLAYFDEGVRSEVDACVSK